MLKIEKFFNESAPISLITNGIRLQREINASLASHEVNLNQALILLSIFFEPEKKIRSFELLDIIPTTKGNISHCTSFLEQKKLISRHTIKNDLRAFEFQLTTKGHKICLNLIKVFDTIERVADNKFSPQRLKDFISVAKKL